MKGTWETANRSEKHSEHHCFGIIRPSFNELASGTKNK